MSEVSGRNDPCPCGSGKKYKKCCLAADEQKAAGARPAAPAPRPAPARRNINAARSIDQAMRAWVTQQQLAPPPEQAIAEARSRLSPGATLTAPETLDIVEPAITALLERGEAAAALELLKALEAAHPAPFEAQARYAALWHMQCALALPPGEDLVAARRLAPHVTSISGLLLDIIDQLAFEGRDEVLSALLLGAWPKVRDDRKLSGWFAEHWLGWTLAFELRRLGRPAPAEGDAAITTLVASLGLRAGDARVRFALRGLRDEPSAGLDAAALARLAEVWAGAGLEARGGEPRGQQARDGALYELRGLVASFANKHAAAQGLGWARGELLARTIVDLLFFAARGRELRRARSTPLADVLLPPFVELSQAFGQLSTMFTRATHARLAALDAWSSWAAFVAERGLCAPDLADQRGRMQAEALGALRQQLAAALLPPAALGPSTSEQAAGPDAQGDTQ